MTYLILLSGLTQNLHISLVKFKFKFDEVITMCMITEGQLRYLFDCDTLRHQQMIQLSSSLILTYRTSSHYVHNTLA